MKSKSLVQQINKFILFVITPLFLAKTKMFLIESKIY